MSIPIISNLNKYSKLALDLRSFLRDRISLEESKRVIVERLHSREKNFLNLVRKGIYENPKSPYLKLLKLAGCELGDIEYMVNRDGLEDTLRKLLYEGVYLSWEEFKGKKDVVRGTTRLRFSEKDFDNPILHGYYHVKTSGTRTSGTRTIFDFNHAQEQIYYYPILLAANNALESPLGLWHPALPSVVGIASVLYYWKIGKPVAKWFSPFRQSQIKTSLRDILASNYIIYGSRLWGARLARAEYVDLSEAVEIARWMATAKKQFGSCFLSCFVSQAVSVCQAAIQNELDIKGTGFLLGGEPLTEAKHGQIQSAGAKAIARYYITEIGAIGFGCPVANAVDDVHFFKDSVALIQHKRPLEHIDVQIDAFAFTTLLPSMPKILLNIESGDFGVVKTHSCGCLFEELGFNEHIHDIRSFAKMTGYGMTIIGSDFVRILEDVLPHKYGGISTDYQLLEEEGNHGRTYLNLIISPKVGVLDEDDVKETVLKELSLNIHGGKLATGFWSQVSALRIKRIDPIATSAKITTLHVRKQQ